MEAWLLYIDLGRPDVNFFMFVRTSTNLILVQFNHIKDNCLFSTEGAMVNGLLDYCFVTAEIKNFV